MAPAPAPGKEPDPAIAAAQAALQLAEQASSVGDLGALKKRVAADPDDHQARFDLAVALNAEGDREDAAERLIEISGDGGLAGVYLAGDQPSVREEPASNALGIEDLEGPLSVTIVPVSATWPPDSA